MVDLAAAEPVAPGLSGLACPGCDYRFTHRQACGIEELTHCPSCGLLNEIPKMTVRPTAAGLALLTDAQARAANWYHITHRKHWLESVIERNVPVYIGTELAALTRAHDAQLRALGRTYWWLHELELAVNTTFSPNVEADRENNWLTSLAEFETHAGVDVDAVRFLNAYEDPGSISLVADPNFLRVKQVTLIHKRDLSRYLLRALVRRETEDKPLTGS